MEVGTYYSELFRLAIGITSVFVASDGYRLNSQVLARLVRLRLHLVALNESNLTPRTFARGSKLRS